MSESAKPEWLEGWQPAPPKPKRAKGGNPAWVPGMKSPNPAGRPKGVVDRRVRASQQMLEGVEQIIEVVKAQALDGDTGAASLILSRVLPALRNQSEKVCFDFDATAPVPRQIEQVLEAMAGGAVAPDVGRQIIDAIGTLGNARAVEDLEARIITLEAKQL